MKIVAKIKSSESAIVFIWCASISFLLLMICSRSSFLYPCNDWNDANSYFTMGKAMMNGQVIYRDLYDQKGPFLYLLYGIAYLLSHDSFAGVFVLEIIAVTIFLFFCHRSIRLYCSMEISCLLLPALGAVILTSKSFYWGGAAEEFCLPLLGISLYHSLRYFKEQYPEAVSMKMIFLNGILAGVIMLVKYTMLGFFFGWMAMMAFACLLRKDWRNLLKGCVIFLGGMFLTALPWLIYFGLNNALDDWYQCYIYNNVFLYSDFQRENAGLADKIYTLAKILYWLIWDNLSCFIFIILGMGIFLLSPRIHWYEKLNILLLSGFLFTGIYVGGSSLPYYSIPLTVFVCLGFAMTGGLLDRAANRKPDQIPVLRKRKGTLLFFMAAVLACGMLYSYSASMNPYFMKQDKSTYFLYCFRDIVRQEEEPTLLNIGCLDAGLYTVADIMPTCKYFQTNGIAFEEMFQEQDRYVKEGKTRFILARDTYPEAIEEKYELVSQMPYEWSGMEFTYFLFRRKD